MAEAFMTGFFVVWLLATGGWFCYALRPSKLKAIREGKAQQELAELRKRLDFLVNEMDPAGFDEWQWQERRSRSAKRARRAELFVPAAGAGAVGCDGGGC